MKYLTGWWGVEFESESDADIAALEFIYNAVKDKIPEEYYETAIVRFNGKKLIIER